MKRFILSMAMLLLVVMSSTAMSYEQARERALFLTDKMAYELNLNDEQYEAAYEVNLDYLMSINTYDDLYGTYWTRRNLDLSYILYDWQYSAFCSAAYFYRPLVWSNGIWRFSIYARYPHRTYFYFGRPGFFATYHGGHSWHMNGGRSWYHGRDFGPRPGDSRFGMRDRFDRGDFTGTRNHGGNGFDRRPGRNGGFDSNRRPGNNGGFNNGNRPGNNNGRPNGNNNGKPNESWTHFDRPTTATRNPSFLDKTKASEFSTMRSSTRSTVDMVQSRDRVKSEPFRNNSNVTRGNFQNSRPASTFTPSRNNSNSSFSSGSTNRGFSSGSSNRGGGFSGGSRPGGGGHFGGRR